MPRFQFEGKTDVWISQVRRVKVEFSGINLVKSYAIVFRKMAANFRDGTNFYFIFKVNYFLKSGPFKCRSMLLTWYFPLINFSISKTIILIRFVIYFWYYLKEIATWPETPNWRNIFFFKPLQAKTNFGYPTWSIITRSWIQTAESWE